MAWRYSNKRLAEIEAEIRDTDARMSYLLPMSGRDFTRFKSKADENEHRELTRRFFLLTNERDRCRLALARRRNGGSLLPREV